MTTNSIATSEEKSMKNVPVLTAQDIGALDALEGEPFCPEFYFINADDQRDYAVGWADIKGHSELTDWFLVGSAVECIEDDYGWIRGGC
jgi:hypothetical protein